jgi:hypothetical protein
MPEQRPSSQRASCGPLPTGQGREAGLDKAGRATSGSGKNANALGVNDQNAKPKWNRITCRDLHLRKAGPVSFSHRFPKRPQFATGASCFSRPRSDQPSVTELILACNRKHRQSGTVRYFKFLIDVVKMNLDRTFREVDAAGNLLVGHSLRNHNHDLPFSWR